MFRKNNSGLSLVKLLIFVAVFGLIIGGFFVLLNNERAKTRDAKRLSDMARIQAAFEFLFNNTATYVAAAENGCNKAGMLVSQCNLKEYLPSIDQFRDPGRFSYTVSKPPMDDDYEVTFQLEKNYSAIKSGRHTLGPAGIK